MRVALIAVVTGAVTGGVLYAALGVVLRHMDDARWAA